MAAVVSFIKKKSIWEGCCIDSRTHYNNIRTGHHAELNNIAGPNHLYSMKTPVPTTRIYSCHNIGPNKRTRNNSTTYMMLAKLFCKLTHTHTHTLSIASRLSIGPDSFCEFVKIISLRYCRVTFNVFQKIQRLPNADDFHRKKNSILKT